jgi:ankyrin repeat protein
MTVDRDGRNGLHDAAAHGQVDALRSLLAVGDDPNLADKSGRTPLHSAAQQGQLEAARLLLNAGAKVDVRDGYGNTALWRATFGNTAVPDLVSMLLDAGADADVQNNAGQSPRDIAIKFDKPGVRELFG